MNSSQIEWIPPIKTSINLPQDSIQVDSPTEVYIDGVNIGKICDAIANMPQFSSKFQLALEKRWQELLEQSEPSQTT